MKNKKQNKRDASIPGTGAGDSHDSVRKKKEKPKKKELIEDRKMINGFFRQIEIAKTEWEKTMDCVGDMIILTDGDGTIKRVNKSVKDFTQKSFKEILGMTWEDLLFDNKLEAMTLYQGCTELRHGPTGRWFELNAYPFNDTGLEFSGNVLTVHETTELKNITEKLEKSRISIEKNRNKLQSALAEICALMQNVIQNRDSSVRFFNPDLAICYEIKACRNSDCPCFGREAMRCWQVAGTFCNDEVQGTFVHKYRNCTECDVYKRSTADPIYEIGEHFNNMMHVLTLKSGGADSHRSPE